MLIKELLSLTITEGEEPSEAQMLKQKKADEKFLKEFLSKLEALRNELDARFNKDSIIYDDSISAKIDKTSDLLHRAHAGCEEAERWLRELE